MTPNSEQPLRLALIGMSGAGKSHWAKNLAAHGCPAVCCGDEIATLDQVLSDLAKDPKRELILDTTGSVIYTGNNILFRLRRQMTVIYIAASADEQQLLIERYLQDPKPVLWRGAFQPRPGEIPPDTVARCYPALIAARRQSYQALAHLTVPTASLREISPPGTKSSPVAGRAFLERIRLQLGQ